MSSMQTNESSCGLTITPPRGVVESYCHNTNYSLSFTLCNTTHAPLRIRFTPPTSRHFQLANNAPRTIAPGLSTSVSVKLAVIDLPDDTHSTSGPVSPPQHSARGAHHTGNVPALSVSAAAPSANPPALTASSASPAGTSTHRRSGPATSAAQTAQAAPPPSPPQGNSSPQPAGPPTPATTTLVDRFCVLTPNGAVVVPLVATAPHAVVVMPALVDVGVVRGDVTRGSMASFLVTNVGTLPAQVRLRAPLRSDPSASGWHGRRCARVHGREGGHGEP
eukprot:TRINITY_DN13741_c0_g1_i1.p1 TRINITY_DN13741_c0_g1~~TRINITY_DN13741_c0_g1_i1.p1  ORF type:complete len:277 (+),score=30.47 TRINITY_DN13741_c0_g1_i1:172-1002(+)